jgi:uncharacterized protein (DUF433 family)
MGRTLDQIIKTLPLSRPRVRVESRYRAGKCGLRRIVSDPEIKAGEPVFEGTRIPLAHVAGIIAKGAPLHEIAADYPHLSRADIHFAAIQSRKKRKPPSPPKPLRFVRVRFRNAVSKARPTTER